MIKYPCFHESGMKDIFKAKQYRIMQRSNVLKIHKLYKETPYINQYFVCRKLFVWQ